MISDAVLAWVPPASGVIVSAFEFAAGLTTEITESAVVVVTSASPVIWLVPVARPKTVEGSAVVPGSPATATRRRTLSPVVSGSYPPPS